MRKIILNITYYIAFIYSICFLYNIPKINSIIKDLLEEYKKMSKEKPKKHYLSITIVALIVSTTIIFFFIMLCNLIFPEDFTKNLPAISMYLSFITIILLIIQALDTNKRHKEQLEDNNKRHKEQLEDNNKRHKEQLEDNNKRHKEQLEDNRKAYFQTRFHKFSDYSAHIQSILDFIIVFSNIKNQEMRETKKEIKEIPNKIKEMATMFTSNQLNEKMLAMIKEKDDKYDGITQELAKVINTELKKYSYYINLLGIHFVKPESKDELLKLCKIGNKIFCMQIKERKEIEKARNEITEILIEMSKNIN